MIPRLNPKTHVSQYRCNRCDRGFTTSGNLKRHVLNFHVEQRNGPTKFICPHCQKAYSRLDYLNQHVKAVHELVNKYPCDQCNKSYTQKGSLTRHVTSIHLNKRDFKCKMCPYQAISHNDLKKHAANLHFRRARYECSICGFGSWTASIIKSHISTFHTETYKLNKVPEVLGTKKCRHCGVFINHTDFRSHTLLCKHENVDESNDLRETYNEVPITANKKRKYLNLPTEDIPWEALCNIKDETLLETPNIVDCVIDGILDQVNTTKDTESSLKS